MKKRKARNFDIPPPKKIKMDQNYINNDNSIIKFWENYKVIDNEFNKVERNLIRGFVKKNMKQYNIYIHESLINIIKKYESDYKIFRSINNLSSYFRYDEFSHAEIKNILDEKALSKIGLFVRECECYSIEIGISYFENSNFNEEFSGFQKKLY